MRKITSDGLNESAFGTSSEFIAHGSGEDITLEIQKDYEKHGEMDKFLFFWQGLLSKLGWQFTKEEILEIAMGDTSLTGETNMELVKNSKIAFFRVWTRNQNKNDIDLEPGHTIGSERVGRRAHYVIKGKDGQIEGWLPVQSVKRITHVTGFAGVSEPHDGSDDVKFY